MTKAIQNAFLSALDDMSEQRGSDRPAGLIVRGPDNEMIIARREDFVGDEESMEVAHEFAFSWAGVAKFEHVNDMIHIQFVDGKSFDIERAPE